ncbi:MAG: hypothetical protein M1822_005930 [Bathelium mastoideum]|nr:MAG: hypothetical protein M1822_005930 [Bathelium mastoideum]
MQTLAFSALFLFSSSLALPHDAYSVNNRALSPYAPVTTACPSTPLVRQAQGISTSEASYIQQRQTKANAALKAWLQKTDPTFPTDQLPIVGLTTSGGGYRALLTGAGVIQAFDARDSNTSLGGLYQALTYEAGLSGGSWLLSSIAGNNWPTITELKTSLWETAFQDSLIDPDGLGVAIADAAVTVDISAKAAAGFDPTLTDPWGRLLSYQLLNGTDGGVANTLHGLTTLSNFTGREVPYPIITSIGVDTAAGQCTPPANGTQYELHPYEFGSWDAGVSAFTQTSILGSNLNNGRPANTSCTTNYDQLGYVLGTSSNLFNEVCLPSFVSGAGAGGLTNLTTALSSLISNFHNTTTRDLYAAYPNPFFAFPSSTLVASQTELTLVDGGETLQNNPIWPFLHRPNVSVLFVNDNSADTSNNYPNGSEILETYVQAQAQGLTRMPAIPPVSTFVSQKLNQKPTFFGCNSNNTLTIIYLPNFNYTTDSGVSTLQLEYSKTQTDALVANGVQVGSYGGNSGFAECVGCAILKKTGATLPGKCASCFSSYCFN